MISTIEIYKAIRERLESNFSDIDVQQKDIKNITRPSFYIQYVGKNFDKIALEYYEDRISFNIVYFSAREELLELLEIEETFIKAFNEPLTIADDDYIIQVGKDAIQANLNEEDYYLNLTIDFVLSQRMTIDSDEENIEYIDMTLKNEEDAELSEYSDVEDEENTDDEEDESSN
ncbi:MAG: hypothetical protein LUE64_06070 [Candidatus Gastranaerophilales bacterium]|nr:hypothetical protein [Candidatus Gastranaerophilales bacterium]